MTPSGPGHSPSNRRQSSANTVTDMFFHQCIGTMSYFVVGCTAATNTLNSRFYLRLAPELDCTSKSCLKFSAPNCGWAVRLKLIGLACVIDCTIVLQLSLLTLLFLQWLTSKMSSTHSWLIQQLSLPYPLYLRSSGGLYPPSIHTPSSHPSSSSDIISSF